MLSVNTVDEEQEVSFPKRLAIAAPAIVPFPRLPNKAVLQHIACRNGKPTFDAVCNVNLTI